MGDKHNPEETKESEVVSRRSFMRKSAEIAALSLFGVVGLDAVVDKVLERIAENQAMGRLSDAAANALKQHRLDYYAGAETCGYKVNCEKSHDCDDYSPECTVQRPFGCTSQVQFFCGSRFICGERVTCQGEGFGCPAFGFRECRRSGAWTCPTYDTPGG